MAYDMPMAPSFDNLKNCTWEKPLLYSEMVELHSLRTEICCCQGHRKRMEDRFIAIKLSFLAASVSYDADLIAVLDGHHTSCAADYVKNALPSLLKTLLEQLHQTSAPNNARIYYALKKTVKQLHHQIIASKINSGTTAIIAFKLANSPQVWTANIGDSTAFIVRDREAIPMSIPQKPLFFGKIKEDGQSLLVRPNFYAKQLMRKGVEVLAKGHEKMDPAQVKGKMFLYYRATDKDGVHHTRLGIPPSGYLNMSRSIGDPAFLPWKKNSPEIFRQTLRPDDMLFLHSDGISIPKDTLCELIEEDRERGYPTRETLSFIVRSSIEAGDNICAILAYSP